MGYNIDFSAIAQCEYDTLPTPRQKKQVSRTVGSRPGQWTQCPPLRKWVINGSDSFMTWKYSPFTSSEYLTCSQGL
ncbi:hypothetical protein J6590_083107, partial [Homalodisca vitripennis]